MTELIIITGLSGAGKSKVINALEDIGYYCVDNMPPMLLDEFADIYYSPDKRPLQKTAVVVDARSGNMFRSLFAELEDLRARRLPYKILYLDAATEVLLQRFKETRRRHPLLEECGGDLQKAIEQERSLLAEVHEIADYTIDTSKLAPSLLRERVVSIFDDGEGTSMLISCMSFGFRNGIPPEADMVFDVRCLPNPFYVPELREHDGTEECVYRYVMDSSESTEFMKKLEELLAFTVPLYIKEGKSQLVVAVGCTGGKHRSVATACRLTRFLQQAGYKVDLSHRDKDRQVLR